MSLFFLLLPLFCLDLVQFTTSCLQLRHPHLSQSPPLTLTPTSTPTSTPTPTPTPTPTSQFITVDLPPSPTPKTAMFNNTTTAAINPQSIEGVHTAATTLNYLVPTLAVITCAITLTIIYTYANISNPYRPYVTGASLSDYSLPGNNRDHDTLSRRYHATSLDPNAVPLPQFSSRSATPVTPAHTTTPTRADLRDPSSTVPTTPNQSTSRSRLQLDENELSFARRKNHLAPTNSH